jgi:hypothetical protein
MKLFRINKIEDFFNSFVRANDILAAADKKFADYQETSVKTISVPQQMTFEGQFVNVVFTLQSIVFVGGHELYYYDVSSPE